MKFSGLSDSDESEVLLIESGPSFGFATLELSASKRVSCPDMDISPSGFVKELDDASFCLLKATDFGNGLVRCLSRM